jgi:hypothetical protein
VDSPSGRPDSRSNGHHTPTTHSPSLRDPSRDLFLDIQALVDGDERKYGASIHRRHDSAVTAGASLSPTYQPAANGQDRMARLLQTVPHREGTAKDAAVEVRQTASSANRVQKAKVMQQELPERLPVEAYNNDCGNSHSGDGSPVKASHVNGKPNCTSSGKSHNNFSLVNGGKSHNSTLNIDNNNSVINSSTSNNNASSCNGSVNYYDKSNVNSGGGFKSCNGSGASDNNSSHNGGAYNHGSGHNSYSYNSSGHNNISGHNSISHNSSGHNNVSRHNSNSHNSSSHNNVSRDNSSGHNSNSHNSSGHNSTNRHVVNFSIEKRKRIELTSLEPNSCSSALLMPASPHITLESVTTASPIHNSSSSNNSNMYTESPRKGGQSSYQEYFDNLISLIDEAARELSV